MLVTLRPPMHSSSSNIEVVPYQHEAEPAENPCPPEQQLCLIIRPGIATPQTTTFT